MKNLFTYNIYQDNKLLKTFENEQTDAKMFGYMLRIQSNSINHAIKYEGYKVEIIDQQTGEKHILKPYF